MRAWTVDADDIRVAEDFDESMLHRTPEIDGFLRSDRDDKFIVIGTKGFGKTLLLKAKRILYQREGRALCLPGGVLLDKPIGDKIFSRELLAFFVFSPLPWSKIWLTAIALATLKQTETLRQIKVGPHLAVWLTTASFEASSTISCVCWISRRASCNAVAPKPTVIWCRGCDPSTRPSPFSSTASTSTSTSTSNCSAATRA